MEREDILTSRKELQSRVKKLEALHERFLAFGSQHIEAVGAPGLAGPVVSPAISPDQLKADIARLTAEIAVAVQATDYTKAATLKGELDGLKSKLKDAQAAPAAAASGGSGEFGGAPND